VEAIVPEGLEPEGFVPAAAAPVVLSIAVEFGFRAAFAALFFIFIFSSFRSGGAYLTPLGFSAGRLRFTLILPDFPAIISFPGDHFCSIWKGCNCFSESWS
jgi:hypothetical protein